MLRKASSKFDRKPTNISMGDAYILQPPKKQKFYRILATLMTFLTIGDQTWWGYGAPTMQRLFRLNRCAVYVLAPVIFLSQVGYFYIHYDELAVDIRRVIVTILPVTGMVNVVIISSSQGSYKKVMKDYMEKIHLYNYLGQNEFYEKKLIQTEKMARWACYFMMFFLMSDWFAWVTIPGVNNYKNWDFIRNKTMRFETVIYAFIPFDYKYDFTNWLIVHVINVYLVWCGCLIIVLHNCINYLFIFQFIGHIGILKHKLEHDFVGDYDGDEIKEKLVGVIKYHSFVLDIFRDIQSAFALNVAAYYFYNLIADSLLLYQLMVGDKGNLMTYGLMLTAYVGGLIVMSFVLEEVRRQSDGLADLAYDLPWEKMSVSNRKMFLFFLTRIQPALVFKAGGLNAGVRPMLSILKSTFSYYVMLKSSMKT